MTKQQTASAARQLLDKQLKTWPKGVARDVPQRGWIYALRKALGMSTKQLAKRLNISQSTAIGIQQSEEKRTIQLDTLQRVAQAMDCTLVYALVPNKPLEMIFAQQLLNKAGHPIRLKPRHMTSPVHHNLLDACAHNIPLGEVWDEA